LQKIAEQFNPVGMVQQRYRRQTDAGATDGRLMP